MFSTLKASIHKRFVAFVDKRMPVEAVHRLSHKTIYIVPTWFGFSFLSFILLLFILGTNYQNNLILFISYLLSSLFVVAMLTSFQNLLGLRLSCQGEVYTQVNQAAEFKVGVEREQALHQVYFSFDQFTKDFVETTNQVATLHAKVTSKKRGIFHLSRFTLTSEYPLGLFKTWSHVRFPVTLVVYPEPLACQINQRFFAQSDEEHGEQINMHAEGEDFFALAPYHRGAPMSRVAWKNVAKGQAWQIKQTASFVVLDEQTLKLSEMPSNQLETKLKYLTYLVLELTQGNQRFALDLGDEKLPIGSGITHSKACLRLIANFAIRNSTAQKNVVSTPKETP